MDDVALANYVVGLNFDHVEAGHIGPEFADLMGVAPGTPIWFSDYTLLKLKERHGDITFENFHYMPRLLLGGFAAHSRKPRHLELWWLDQRHASPSALSAVLKATVRKEIFVATFHPMHRREVRRLAYRAERDGRLIRVQPGYADFRTI